MPIPAGVFTTPAQEPSRLRCCERNIGTRHLGHTAHGRTSGFSAGPVALSSVAEARGVPCADRVKQTLGEDVPAFRRSCPSIFRASPAHVSREGTLWQPEP